VSRDHPGSAKRLIVNADDLGYDPSIDRGILEAARDGIVTSATVLVTSPFARDAVAQAKAIPLSLGLHVNLVRGAPITRAPWIAPRGEMNETSVAAARPRDVAAEIEAQLSAFAAIAAAPPTHLDVHRHAHRHPVVLSALLEVAQRRTLPVRVLDSGMRDAARTAGVACADHFIGDADVEPYWTPARLAAAISALADGVTELMCHPGYAPTVVTSRYSTQRDVERQTFCAPGLRQELARFGVALCDYQATRG
jgi:predicted glycoside hydrolase/deacetylase ChbG (UPF0249 family)